MITMVTVAAAPSTKVIIGALVVQGLPIALSQPTANLVLSGLVGGRARGPYFGIVQSSIPASILLSGLMLGTVVSKWGWRPPFLLVAALALVGVLTARRDDPHGHSREPDVLEPAEPLCDDVTGTGPRWPCLVLLGTGGLLGSGTATVLPAFAPSAGRDAGLEASTVGFGIAVASIVCIAMRVGASALGGWLRSEQALVLLAVLLLGSVAGYNGMSLGDRQAFLVFIVVAYGLGWGWPGVLNLAVTAARPEAVGTMTGRTQAAMFAGGMAGPAAFGIAAERAGCELVWTATAVFAAVAAGCFLGAALLWPRGRAPEAIALDKMEVSG